jgi:hypothetical protein
MDVPPPSEPPPSELPASELAAPPPPADPPVDEVALDPVPAASKPATPVPSRPPSRPAAINVWEPPTPLLFRDVPGINGAPPSRCHFPHELSDRDYLQRLLEMIPQGLWPTIQACAWDIVITHSSRWGYSSHVYHSIFFLFFLFFSSFFCFFFFSPRPISLL